MPMGSMWCSSANPSRYWNSRDDPTPVRCTGTWSRRSTESHGTVAITPRITASARRETTNNSKRMDRSDLRLDGAFTGYRDRRTSRGSMTSTATWPGAFLWFRRLASARYRQGRRTVAQFKKAPR
jgi:hypothetical protein